MISLETFILNPDEATTTPPRPFYCVLQDILRWIVYIGVFMIPFVPLIVTNGMIFPNSTGKNFTFRIIVEIIFAAWILLALYNFKYRPKFSWILGSFGIFVTVVFFADIFGVDPIKSLWGNYERMEGFIAIAHLFMYFIVVSSILKSEKLWHLLFNISLTVAVIVSLLAMQEIGQGIERIGGTLGKSTFLAVYMLLHVFISFLMLIRSKNNWTKFLFAAIAIIFIFILFHTVTRGTILGLVGGLLTTTLYIAIFERKSKTLRRIAIGGVVSVILLTGSFIAARNTDFIQEKPIMSRLATISIDSGEARFALWAIAYEGFKERPLLGWGQENYNYVFNKYYKPSLYSQEQWFDRTHNIFLEWLIAGGLLGLVAYIAIFCSTIYYLVVRPIFKNDDKTFTPTERGVLLGLLLGYMIHNLFVFDEIVSYIFYVTILSFIHIRVSASIPQTNFVTVPNKVVTLLIAPVVAVGLVATVYFINIPRIQAAADFFRAHTIFGAANSNANVFNSQITLEQRNLLYLQSVELFNSALTKNRFADMEFLEQLTLLAPTIFSDQNISTSTKERFASVTEAGFLRQLQDRPKDTKLQAFTGSFYGSLGAYGKAIMHYQIARELSPKKQPVLLSLGLIYIENGQFEEAKSVFKETYEYAPEFSNPRNLYAVSAIYTEDWNLLSKLIDSEHEESFLESPFVVGAFYRTGNLSRLEPMLIRHIVTAPDDLQKRILLASVQVELGNTALAIQTTRETMKLFPEFKSQGEKFIEGL